MRAAAIWMACTLSLGTVGCGSNRGGLAPLMMIGMAAPCIDPTSGMMRGTYELWCDPSYTTCEFRVDGTQVSTCTGGSTSQSCVDAARAAADACVNGPRADGGGTTDGGSGTRDAGTPAGTSCLHHPDAAHTECWIDESMISSSCPSGDTLVSACPPGEFARCVVASDGLTILFYPPDDNADYPMNFCDALGGMLTRS